MKRSYFELLSPEPLPLPGVGGILSPTLRQIARIGYPVYQYYLAMLSMNEKTYLTMLANEDGRTLPEEEMSQFHMFELFLMNEGSIDLLQDILNFFLKEEVVYSARLRGYLVYDGEEQTGMITGDNYAALCDVICQRNGIEERKEEDLSKVKGKKTLEIIKKLQIGRTELAKQTKPDENMELGNIISAVANKSNSLNLLNIWDLTVFQIWDCFYRLSNNTIYDIQSMSVAAWGNKDRAFDAAAWYKMPKQ